MLKLYMDTPAVYLSSTSWHSKPQSISKYQAETHFSSLWYDLTGDRTPSLPMSGRAKHDLDKAWSWHSMILTQHVVKNNTMKSLNNTKITIQWTICCCFYLKLHCKGTWIYWSCHDFIVFAGRVDSRPRSTRSDTHHESWWEWVRGSVNRETNYCETPCML